MRSAGRQTPAEERLARERRDEEERDRLALINSFPGGSGLARRPVPYVKGKSRMERTSSSRRSNLSSRDGRNSVSTPELDNGNKVDEMSAHDEAFFKNRVGRKGVTVEFYRMRSRIKQLKAGLDAPLYPLANVPDIVALFDENENKFIEPDELPFVLKACDLRPSSAALAQLSQEYGDEEGWIPNDKLILWLEDVLERKRRTGTQRLREKTALPDIDDLARRRAEARRRRRRFKLMGRNAVRGSRVAFNRKRKKAKEMLNKSKSLPNISARSDGRGRRYRQRNGSPQNKLYRNLKVDSLLKDRPLSKATLLPEEKELAEREFFHPLGTVKSVKPIRGGRRGQNSFRVSPIRRRPYCNFGKFERLRREDESKGTLAPRGAAWLSVHETVVNASGEYKTFADLRREKDVENDRKCLFGEFKVCDHQRLVARRDALARSSLLNDHGVFRTWEERRLDSRMRKRERWLHGDFRLA
eukprot:g4892.t1